VDLQTLRRIGPLRPGIPRSQVTVPISPDGRVDDTVLFQNPADAAKVYYLPRYRLRITPATGHYEITTSLADGLWRMTLGLESFPAPEISRADAVILPHELTVSVSSGGQLVRDYPVAEFTPGFGDTQVRPEVVLLLTLPERDALLRAFTRDEEKAQLVVHRSITVAVPSVWRKPGSVLMIVAKPDSLNTPVILPDLVLNDGPNPIPEPIRVFTPVPIPDDDHPGPRPNELQLKVLMQHHRDEMVDEHHEDVLQQVNAAAARGDQSFEQSQVQSAAEAPLARAGRVRDHRAPDVVVRPRMPHWTSPTHRGPPPAPPRALPEAPPEAAADASGARPGPGSRPRPGPRAPVRARQHHAGRHRAAPVRCGRPPLPVPLRPAAGLEGVRHPGRALASRRALVTQPRVLPGSERRQRLLLLCRRLPHRPARGGTLRPEPRSAGADAQTSTVKQACTGAICGARCRRRGRPAAHARGGAPELRPAVHPATCTLELPGGAITTHAPPDLVSGWWVSESFSFDDLPDVYAILTTGAATSALLRGRVDVTVDDDIHQVPVELRLDRPAIPPLSWTEKPGPGGSVTVTLLNVGDVELTIPVLPAWTDGVPAPVTGALPAKLAPGATLDLVVTPSQPGKTDVTLDVSGVRVVVEPEQAVSQTLDRRVERLPREVTLITTAKVFDTSGDDERDLADIGIQFEGVSGAVLLNKDTLQAKVAVPVPLEDWLLDRGLGSFNFRQTLVHASGSSRADTDWRSTDSNLLPLPQP
jgi:hypothetical protein